MTATFYRAVYAIPVLAVISLANRRAVDARARREHLLAFASGLILAADLDLWHESIALIGAGLGTVIPNVQIVFVALVGVARYRRAADAPRTIAMIGVVLAGVALTSGLARERRVRHEPGARGRARRRRGPLLRGVPDRVSRVESRAGAAGRTAARRDVGTAIGALLSAGSIRSFTFAGERPGAPVAGARSRSSRRCRVAADRDGAAAAAGGRNLGAAPGPAGVRDCLGRAVLRRTPVAAAVDGLGDRAGWRGDAVDAGVRSSDAGV